jgi:hypothetical protein
VPYGYCSDRNDLMPAQEKLEWVTPKISLMEAVLLMATNYKTQKTKIFSLQNPLTMLVFPDRFYLKPRHT